MHNALFVNSNGLASRTSGRRMNSLSMWRPAGHFRAAICAFLVALAAALSVPALAQNVQNSSVGLPQDWSHRHLIYANPETHEEHQARNNASGKAESDSASDWSKKANDPRFVRAFERRERLAAAPTHASASSGTASAADYKPFANRNWQPVAP